MKLTISRYSTKTIQTSRGDSLVCNFNAGGKWYNAFVGKWNENWKDGMTVEVLDSQITSKEKNGKTYWNVNAPPKEDKAAQSSKNEERILSGLAFIYKQLEQVNKELYEIKKKLGIPVDQGQKRPAS